MIYISNVWRKALQKVIQFINDNILWGVPMIILILGVGIYLTVRNRFTQVTKFPYAVKMTMGKTLKGIGKGKGKKGDGISQFEAFSTAIAGTVGTGNIVGVATAIISGGPGAVFWMWLSAFVGMFTNFAENVLGIYYRKKGKDGEYRGGPMYYISEGLGWKWLAILFAIFCMFAAFGMNMVQINTIADTLNGGFKIPKWVSGVVVAIIIALIIIGGIKRIGKITSYIIPFMCVGFMIMAIVIICINIKAIPSALSQIFKNAFSFKSVGGGVLGYAIMRSMRYGLARGIFSNEAGLGSSVIAHSASSVRACQAGALGHIRSVFGHDGHLHAYRACHTHQRSIRRINGRYKRSNAVASGVYAGVRQIRHCGVQSYPAAVCIHDDTFVGILRREVF